MDNQDSYIKVRRKKQTFLILTKNSITVFQLKTMLQSLTGVLVNDIRFFNENDVVMEDGESLASYSFDINTAPAERPAEISMVYRVNGVFEDKDVTPYATPPPLPEVLQPSTSGFDDE